MAWELVTFATLKSFLGLTDSHITDYPPLNIIKPMVEAKIDNYLGRYLESAERTETFYVTGPTDIIPLAAIPITEVASLVITMLDEDETYTDDDYYITGYGLQVFEELKDAKIEITYTGGLSTVPDIIERAAMLQTAYEFLAKDQVGASSVSTEGGFVTRPELGLLKDVKESLNKYMHPLKITG